MKRKIYISGPLTDTETGKPSARNIEIFRRAEELLKIYGYSDTVNPIRMWVCRWLWLYKIVGYKLTLLYDLWLLLRCDMIFKIPGWQQSKGANIESCMAYHMNIQMMPRQIYGSICHKLEKYIIKLEKK
jgi:hypothetical protein